MTVGRLLWRALRRHRGRVAVGVGLLSAHQTAEALVPVAIGVIIDRAVATGDLRALLVSVLGLAVLFTLLALAYRFGARQTTVAVQRETHLLCLEVTGRLLDPRGQADPPRSGESLTIATSDAEKAARIVEAAGRAAAGLTALAVSSAVLLTIDVALGIGVLVGVPLLVTLPQALAPRLTRRSAAQQAATAGGTALATDLVHGLRALQGLGAQRNAADRYRGVSQHALAVTLRTARTAGVAKGLTATASGLFLAGVAGFAGWLALEGRLTVGELVTVVGLAQFVAEPIQLLGLAGRLAAPAHGSAGRLVARLTAPPLIQPGDQAVPVLSDGQRSDGQEPDGRRRDGQGPDGRRAAWAPSENGARLALGGVSYRGLRDVHLHVAPGELLGVVCDDPRDADALLALLAGQVPRGDYQGRVMVGGAAAETLDLDSLRRAVLVEQHDTQLFEGTLRDNLLARPAPDAGAAETDPQVAVAAAGEGGSGAGKNGSSAEPSAEPPDGSSDGSSAEPPDRHLERALRAAAAEEIAAAHPDGVDQPVADRGRSLSGGQRQRVGLARALVADPPVLVLHDPTTAVDAVTEERIAAGLAALRGSGTASTIVLTGSPALLSHADRVVVMEGGRVRAEGSHAELAGTDRRYQEAVLR